MGDAFAAFGFNAGGTNDFSFNASSFTGLGDPAAGQQPVAGAQQPAVNAQQPAVNAGSQAVANALNINVSGDAAGGAGFDITAIAVPPAPTNAGGAAGGNVAATPAANAGAQQQPAAGNAAAGGAFTIDFTSAAATGTTAAGATGAAGGAAVPAAPAGDPALRLKDKTVEEILTQWSRDLEDHVSAFTEQALRVRHRDQQLIEQGQKIMNLQRALQNVQIDQLKLTRVLETIRSNEDDLSAMIGQLEQAVDANALKRTTSPDDVKREETFKLAETVDAQLNAMGGDLHDIIATLNKATDSALDPAHPMTAVVKILNAHMTSLQYIEQASTTLDARLRGAAQLLHAAGATAKR